VDGRGVPVASSEAARATMRANRGRDTGPELDVRRALHAMGLRYRVDYPLPINRRRRADIAFTRAKVAVFIDGCFWHGCPDHGTTPRTNSRFWSEKIERNRARDADTTELLSAAGWTVMRFWEHDEPSVVAVLIYRSVHRDRLVRTCRERVEEVH
jgi:DNA mismatch endonuclease, patch repair protein